MPDRNHPEVAAQLDPMKEPNNQALRAREDYCSACSCGACRRAQQRVSIIGALAKDANSRCWSCSCGWTGCYTSADIAQYGEPSECNLCCRERLEECDPPALATLTTDRHAEGRLAGLEEAAPDEDWLTDVIDDSLDMDWTGRVGARAIIAAWQKRHD